MSTQNLNLGRETLISMAAKAGTAIAGFIGVVIFARLLGAKGLGEYYYLVAIAQVATQIPNGIGSAAQKRISEVESNPGQVLGFATIMNFAIVAVLAPAILLVEAYLPFSLDTIPEIVKFVLVFAVLIGGNGLYNIFNNAYAGNGNPAKATWFHTVRSVLVLGSQLAFIYFGFEVIGLLIGQASGSMLTTGLLYLFTSVSPRHPSREVSESVLRFAKWSIPNGLFNRFYEKADPIVIGAVVGSTAVGHFEAAMRLGLPAAMVASSISRPLNVKVSARTSAGKEVLDDLRNAASYSTAAAIPLLFGGAALARPLLRTVYGPEFIGAETILIAVLAYFVVYVFSFPFTSAFGGADRPDIGFALRAVSVAVYVPAVAIGVTRYGALGVIGATILAELTQNVAIQYATKRVFGATVLPRPILAQVGAGAVMFLSVRWMLGHVTVTGWPVLLALVGAGAIVYGGSLTAFSRHFRHTARSLFGDVLPAATR